MMKVQVPTVQDLMLSAFVLVLVVDADDLHWTFSSGDDAWEIFQITRSHSKVTCLIFKTMTSTPPVVFKRTKVKTAQRTRQSSPDNDTDNAITATGDDSPSTLATKLKNKVKKKPKSRLSFGGDEDEVYGCTTHQKFVLIWGFQ